MEEMEIMKQLKVWSVMLLMAILVFSGSSLCLAQAETMTNTQFAGMLVDVLGLEMPADADTFSEAEIFEIWANMLAEKDIVLFADAQPNVLVTRGGIAEVLYDALIGLSDVTIEDKIDYLADLGYISTGGADDIMSFIDITAALNIPALSKALAEAYSSPPGRKGEPVRTDPPPEGPASSIQ